MKFTRKINIEENQEKGRVLVIYGPRRVGKTTLLKHYLEKKDPDKTLYETGDDIDLRVLINSEKRKSILDYTKPYEFIGIDEAQNIKKIGLGAKMIIDEYPEKKIILTGSSSFELIQNVGEPLVGRHYSLPLLPIAYSEYIGTDYEKKKHLEEFLIYGNYPEISLADDYIQKQKKLSEIIDSYLLKDILAFEKLRSPELLLNILRALAYQLGSEVSLYKLTKDIGESDHKKVGRYLEVLEKSYIIKKVFAYSTNPRNEISKKVKYYFYDVGIRNAVINNFNAFIYRDGRDIGGLWENYVFMELYKKNTFENIYFNNIYFWRDKKAHEIDIIIEKNGSLYAYECKYSKDTSENIRHFTEHYPTAQCAVVNKDNFTEFLS